MPIVPWQKSVYMPQNYTENWKPKTNKIDEH